MKRAIQFVIRNWIPLTIGFLATAAAVRIAYNERGYIAVGSEWLILPFTILLFKWVKEFMEYDLPIWIELFHETEEDEE